MLTIRIKHNIKYNFNIGKTIFLLLFMIVFFSSFSVSGNTPIPPPVDAPRTTTKKDNILKGVFLIRASTESKMLSQEKRDRYAENIASSLKKAGINLVATENTDAFKDAIKDLPHQMRDLTNINALFVTNFFPIIARKLGADIMIPIEISLYPNGKSISLQGEIAGLMHKKQKEPLAFSVFFKDGQYDDALFTAALKGSLEKYLSQGKTFYPDITPADQKVIYPPERNPLTEAAASLKNHTKYDVDFFVEFEKTVPLIQNNMHFYLASSSAAILRNALTAVSKGTNSSSEIAAICEKIIEKFNSKIRIHRLSRPAGGNLLYSTITSGKAFALLTSETDTSFISLDLSNGSSTHHATLRHIVVRDDSTALEGPKMVSDGRLIFFTGTGINKSRSEAGKLTYQYLKTSNIIVLNIQSGKFSEIGDLPFENINSIALLNDNLYILTTSADGSYNLMRCATDGNNRKNIFPAPRSDRLISHKNFIPKHLFANPVRKTLIISDGYDFYEYNPEKQTIQCIRSGDAPLKSYSIAKDSINFVFGDDKHQILFSTLNFADGKFSDKAVFTADSPENLKTAPRFAEIRSCKRHFFLSEIPSYMSGAAPVSNRDMMFFPYGQGGFFDIQTPDATHGIVLEQEISSGGGAAYLSMDGKSFYMITKSGRILKISPNPSLW